jgi:hypothetical protein
VRVPGFRQVEAVDVLEVGRQVRREGDEAAEGHGVQERHLPGQRQLDRRDELGDDGSRVGSPQRRVAHHRTARDAVAASADRDDHVRRGVAEPVDEPRGEERRQGGAAHAGAEHPGSETPAGGLVPRVDERMPTANVVPAMPRRKPNEQQQRVRPAVAGEADEQHRGTTRTG